MYAPVTGVITAHNENIKSDPAIVNNEAENDGWVLKVKVDSASEGRFCQGQESAWRPGLEASLAARLPSGRLVLGYYWLLVIGCMYVCCM